MSQAHHEDNQKNNQKQNRNGSKMDESNNGTGKSNGRVITDDVSSINQNNGKLYGTGCDVIDKIAVEDTTEAKKVNEERNGRIDLNVIPIFKNGLIKCGDFLDNERREESAILTVINEEKIVQRDGLVDTLEAVVLSVIDEENKGDIVVPPRRRQSDEASKVIFPPPRRGSADATKRRQSDEIPKSPLTATEPSRRHSAESADETLRRSGIGCAESGVLRPRTSLTSLASQDATTPAVVASPRPSAPVRGRLYSSSSDRANGKRSLPPMSSMEEENLRERIHASLIKQCAEYVYKEQRYTKDTFKRMFQSKVELIIILFY